MKKAQKKLSMFATLFALAACDAIPDKTRPLTDDEKERLEKVIDYSPLIHEVAAKLMASSKVAWREDGEENVDEDYATGELNEINADLNNFLDNERIVAFNPEQHGQTVWHKNGGGVAYTISDGIETNNFIGIAERLLSKDRENPELLPSMLYHEAAHHKYSYFHSADLVRLLHEYPEATGEKKENLSKKLLEEIITTKDSAYLIGIFVDFVVYTHQREIEWKAEFLKRAYNKLEEFSYFREEYYTSNPATALNEIIESHYREVDGLLSLSREEFAEKCAGSIVDIGYLTDERFNDGAYILERLSVTRKEVKDAILESSMYDYYRERISEAREIGRENLERLFKERMNESQQETEPEGNSARK